MVSEPRNGSMAWMETDCLRWKIKWRLEHVGALGIMGETVSSNVKTSLVFCYKMEKSFPTPLFSKLYKDRVSDRCNLGRFECLYQLLLSLLIMMVMMTWLLLLLFSKMVSLVKFSLYWFVQIGGRVGAPTVHLCSGNAISPFKDLHHRFTITRVNYEVT